MADPVSNYLVKSATDFCFHVKEIADDVLETENFLTKKLEWVEQKTGLNKRNGMYIISFLLIVYLFVGAAATTLSWFLTTLYPLWWTFNSFDSGSADEHMTWLVYWLIYGVCQSQIAGHTPGSFSIVVPTVTLLLVQLYHPKTQGANYLFIKWVQPLLQVYHDRIDIDVIRQMDPLLFAFIGIADPESASDQTILDNLSLLRSARHLLKVVASKSSFGLVAPPDTSMEGRTQADAEVEVTGQEQINAEAPQAAESVNSAQKENQGCETELSKDQVSELAKMATAMAKSAFGLQVDEQSTRAIENVIKNMDLNALAKTLSATDAKSDPKKSPKSKTEK